MNEGITPATIGTQKAETFVMVEPFDDAVLSISRQDRLLENEMMPRWRPLDVAERIVRFESGNQTRSQPMTSTETRPASEHRTMGIWVSELLGCFMTGAFIAHLLSADEWGVGATGLTLLFVCFRLWMREKRIE